MKLNSLPHKGNILFIAPSAYVLGGLATWLDYLLPGLAKRGWNIILGLVSGHFHNVESYLKMHPFRNTVGIENETGSREGRIRSIIKTLLEVNPDIVVGVNIPDTYAAAERIRGKKHNKTKTVMTIHGIQPDLYEDAKEFNYVLDAVICTNRLACKLVENESNIDKKCIYYASYGVKVPVNLMPVRNNDGILRIAYSGRLDHWQKRVNDIPEILSHLKNKGFSFECVIAGGGPAEKDFLNKISEKGLSDNIRFLGSLSYEEVVRKVYEKADILLITSFWETGPIVAWEAMSHGLAVVTSKYVGSGLEDSLKDKENCLMFPVGDTQSAADCIESLNNPVLREHIVKAGYQLVQTRYSQKNSIECWHTVFEKILSSISLKSEKRITAVPSAGRLDKLFSVRFAETVRQAIGRKFIHNVPGGEWPHSYGKRKEDDGEFWEKAHDLDNV